MQTNKKKVPWIFVAIGGVFCVWLGYLIGGAWRKGIQAPEFINRFMDVLEHPFRNYFNAYTLGAIVVVLITYGVVILMYYTSIRNYMFGKEYGSAQFANPKEVNEKIKDKNENRNKIISQNVRMSYDTRYTQLNNNTLVVGGSGAGKTIRHVEPNIIQFPQKVSLVITDSKGENLSRNGNILRACGYKVKVLNLINMEQSDGYNPFDYIRNETDINRLITNLMANTTPKGAQSAEPFWEKAESLFLQAIFKYVWMEAKPSQRNFRTVMQLMNEAEVTEQNKPSRLDVKMKFLESTHPLGARHPAVISYNKCMRGAGDTIRSIIISVNARLAPLENEQILRIFDRDEMNLAELGIGVNGDEETRTALFCVIPDSDKTYNFVVGMLDTQLFQELYFQADVNYGGRLPIHVSFILDEFANVALPEDFCSLLSTMRSREISATIIIQNLAQIKALFKDTWETITGNCDTFIYLGGNEQSTHKYVSELLGKGTIDKRSTGETRGRQGSASRNYDVLGRELYTPDEVRKLDNKKCFVFIRGFDPILDDKYDTFNHPFFEQTAMGKGTPYVHEPKKHGNFIGKSFELLSPKAVSYFAKRKEKGENIYIDSLSYEQFCVLTEVAMQKRFMEVAEQEEKAKHNEKHTQELEYEESSASASSSGEKQQTKGSRNKELVGEDSITNRMVTWTYTKEQKNELRKAMEMKMPKDEILKFFYPEMEAEEMARQRETFKNKSRKN